MSSVKVAISLDEDMLRHVDDLVARAVFRSRSRAIQTAIGEKLARMEKSRLATECAKLDVRAEQALAEEGIGHEAKTWPEF
jgi:metal-responsive CopG/Arc/MetJ family transcriptional regulator